jgi:hypothetical protein
VFANGIKPEKCPNDHVDDNENEACTSQCKINKWHSTDQKAQQKLSDLYVFLQFEGIGNDGRFFVEVNRNSN